MPEFTYVPQQKRRVALSRRIANSILFGCGGCIFFGLGVFSVFVWYMHAFGSTYITYRVVDQINKHTPRAFILEPNLPVQPAKLTKYWPPDFELDNIFGDWVDNNNSTGRVYEIKVSNCHVGFHAAMGSSVSHPIDVNPYVELRGIQIQLRPFGSTISLSLIHI